MWIWFLGGIWVLGWTCIPHLLLLNKRPTATLAWLWALLLLPIFGPAFYLMIGTERIKRARIRRRLDFRSKSAVRGKTHGQRKEELPAKAERLARCMSAITQLPLSTVQSVKVLRNAVPYYAALKEDIRQAKDHIHIETYIWRADEVGAEFLDLLVAAANRGVTVRVLVDELGSLTLKERYFRPLIKAGGQFSWCHTLSPLRSRYSFNLRNHRKLQIIDGASAYVGGMNFGREYLGRDPTDGEWADVQVRLEGPIVDVLQEIFAEDWFFGSGKDDVRARPSSERLPDGNIPAQVLRGGPDEEDHPMLRANLELSAHAEKRLWIACGYFVPGEIMQTALQVAAARGVDVRLLVSRKSEHPLLVKAGRSYYDALLRCGVRIFEFSQGIEHSKYIIVDDDWVSVGSCNLDERSMRLNFELNVLIHCGKTNQEMSRIFKATLEEARKIDRQAFASRPYRERLIDSAMRVLSPVL